MLAWYRDLIALRRQIDGDLELLDARPGIVAFRRGRHVIALNLGDAPQAPPAARELVLATPMASLAARRARSSLTKIENPGTPASDSAASMRSVAPMGATASRPRMTRMSREP